MTHPRPTYNATTVAAIISIPFAWYAMDKLLAKFAYHISVDVLFLFYASSGVLLIALVTVSFESIRAASASPVKSLRNE